VRIDDRKGLLRRGLVVGAAVALVLLVSVLYTVFFAPIGQGSEVVAVRIAPGSSLGAIGATLHQAGVLTHRQPFLLAARLRGLDRKLRSGDFEIHPSWNLPTLLNTLLSGRGRMLSVTLPEGITLRQIADRLEAAGITNGEAFLLLCRDRAFLDRLGIPAPTAEGFLFPETYIFSPSSRPEEVITVMYSQFRDIFRELEAESPRRDGSLLELVTLASLVEKETSLPEERPLVAAVFANRLRQGYRLQSDPSVIYGIEDFNGNLTRKDLETPTPYNTYAIRGLPPGPIASPGRGSLWAALNPARADYLYFVSRNDGSHHFSRSLEEHNRAVREYQLAGGKR